MPNAEVSIHVELTGENACVWVYGWSGNKYRDYVSVTLTKAQGPVVCCVRESCRGRWQVLICFLPAPSSFTTTPKRL